MKWTRLVKAENVSVKDLESRAKHYEELLKEEGYTDMKVSPNFAYGAYGFYFDWTRDDGKPGQKYTGLGTKKETLNNLKTAYYDLVNRIDWFMKRKSSLLKKKANNPEYDKTVDDLRNEFVSFVADKRPDDVNAAPVVYDYFMGLAKHYDVHSKLRDCYNGSEKESWEKFDELLNLVRYWWNNYNK